MKKIKKKYNSYIFIFIVFATMNIFFIWIISNILFIDNKLKVENVLLSENARYLNINGINKIYNKQLIDLFSEEEFLMENTISSRENQILKGVFYNYNIEKNFELNSGRMFNLNELIQGEKVAIVGFDFKDEIKDGNIFVNNQIYNVVGILENQEELNKTIYLNMNASEENINGELIKIDVNANQDIYEKVSIKIKEEFAADMNIGEIESVINPLKVALGENNIHIALGVLTGISLISLIINIGIYWIDKEKKFIGIESLVGATKVQIAIKLWKEYMLVVIASQLSSIIVWNLIKSITGAQNNLTLVMYMILLVINLMISTLAIAIPIIKLLRLEINTIIKENI